MTGIDPRLLIGATTLAPGQGGIACVARMTAKALIERYRDIEVLSYLDKKNANLSGVAVRAARGSRLTYLAACHRAAIRSTHAIYDSVGPARAHPRFGPLNRPFAVWVHGVEIWYDSHPGRLRVLREANLILANSQFTLDRFRSLRGDLNQAKTCWLATERDDPPEASPDSRDAPAVLILGRIDADQDYKGHRELISIWPDVVSAVPAARLIIAGGGSGYDAIAALVKASPAASAIEMTGFVPDEQMSRLWRRASVFAMPSRNEGFGIVYAEAMRHGVPVIASIHDAASEINVDSVTGYNISLDRAGELCERLIYLLRNPGAAASLGRAGHERWLKHFRYSVFKERLHARLSDFIERSGASA